MPFVIMSPCEGTCAAACIEHCPVDCIYPPEDFILGVTDPKEMLKRPKGEGIYVIDPDVCIDCGACVTPCPTDAVKDEIDVPAHEQEYVEINRIEADKRA